MSKSYPSDLTDLEWQILKPLVPKPRTTKGGRPRTVDIRQVLNAIFYVLKGGITWRMLPKDFPPPGTVYYYFWLWKNDGSIERIHDKLRSIARVQADKKPYATAGIIDSQSVKATEEVSEGKGFDAGKKNKREKATHSG